MISEVFRAEPGCQSTYEQLYYPSSSVFTQTRQGLHVPPFDRSTSRRAMLVCSPDMPGKNPRICPCRTGFCPCTSARLWRHLHMGQCVCCRTCGPRTLRGSLLVWRWPPVGGVGPRLTWSWLAQEFAKTRAGRSRRIRILCHSVAHESWRNED